MRRIDLGSVLILLMIGAATSAQSLGEVARQEEARRHTTPSSGKVYTNESLRPEPAPTPPVSPAPVSVAAAPDTSSAAAGQGAKEKETAASPLARPPADVKKDEIYWRTRLEQARTAIARGQMFRDALQSQINGLTTDYANRDNPVERQKVAADRTKALGELDRVVKEIEQGQKLIADIQEEARRDGVPAGWVR